ncbi:hypothetical protein, partial [Escherichia coli]|uniref:hypothetical protein n=1 Tax=Escherichia coli TaxID=562 RepID=UPI001BB04EC9
VIFILTFQNHTNRPLTDFGGKTSIFSHPVYLFLREFSLQDFRGGSLASEALTAHNARTTNQLKEITQHSPASIAGSFHR